MLASARFDLALDGRLVHHVTTHRPFGGYSRSMGDIVRAGDGLRAGLARDGWHDIVEFG